MKSILLNVQDNTKDEIKKGSKIKDMTVSAYIRYCLNKESVRLGVKKLK